MKTWTLGKFTVSDHPSPCSLECLLAGPDIDRTLQLCDSGENSMAD